MQQACDLPQMKEQKNVRAGQLGGGCQHAQKGVPASCFHSCVVHAVVLHFMSLVTKEQQLPSLQYVYLWVTYNSLKSPGCGSSLTHRLSYQLHGSGYVLRAVLSNFCQTNDFSPSSFFQQRSSEMWQPLESDCLGHRLALHFISFISKMGMIIVHTSQTLKETQPVHQQRACIYEALKKCLKIWVCY